MVKFHPVGSLHLANSEHTCRSCTSLIHPIASVSVDSSEAQCLTEDAALTSQRLISFYGSTDLVSFHAFRGDSSS